MPDTKLTLDDSIGLAVIVILALPMLAAIICALVRGSRDARWVALVTWSGRHGRMNRSRYIRWDSVR